MNIDEIALRVAEQIEQRGRTYSPDHYIDVVKLVLAELSKEEAPVIASEQKPVAWVDVIDRHEGPYNFNGLELLDSGKHLLFTSPPNPADIKQRVAEAYEQGQQSCSQFDIWMQNPYTKVLENSDKESYEQGKRDAVPEWLPIETAPKDGTEILLRSKNGRIANGVWMTANDRVGAWLWPYIKVEPAHWMPLPAAPKQEK